MKLTVTLPKDRGFPKLSESVFLGSRLDSQLGKLEKAIYDISQSYPTEEDLTELAGKPISLNQAGHHRARQIGESFNDDLIWILKKQLKAFSAEQWQRIKPRIEYTYPIAESYRLLLELADEVLDIFPAESIGYGDAVEWWRQIMIEEKFSGIFQGVTTKLSKRQLKQEIRAERKTLKLGEKNPYDDSLYPAKFNLIECCLLLWGKKESTENFRKIWVDFLDIHKELINAIDLKGEVEFVTTSVRGNSVIAHTGGHTFQSLYHHQKKISNRGKRQAKN